MWDNDLLEIFTDTARQHLTHVEQRVSQFGLHAGQGAVIAALRDHGPCTQKDLTLLRRVSAPTISVMISRMENSGLVTRTSMDGRSSLISLTKKGEKLGQKLAEDRVGEPERIFAGLTEEEKVTAEKIFRMISDNLDRYNEDSDGGSSSG